VLDTLRSDLDLIAFAWFVATVSIYRLTLRFQRLERHSIVGAVQEHRVSWMKNMALRDPRVLDAVLLGSLSQGNAFFASTAAIGIGGLAAIFGSGDKIQLIIERLPYAQKSSATLYELKLVLLMAVFVYAFFKFAWAFRLSHYVAIMIGSTPPPKPELQLECELHARRTARLIGIAAEHANGGLRAFYYAFAALTWFYHPLLFILSTAAIHIIMIRRDYFSRSRRILNGSWP
jgi:uncharacterized membrane protein